MSSSTPTVVPRFNVIQPTPPRNYKDQHRLLYRGSLSLPDSDLVLEGITFTAHIPPSSPSLLLESPIALALESMRGRPSLRFISVVKLKDVNWERCVGEINMYIHPRSVIAKTFFENVLCAESIRVKDGMGCTEDAVRIGLGDGHGPDDSDLLIFGTLLPPSSSPVPSPLGPPSSQPSSSPQKTTPKPRIRLTLARLTPPPAPTRKPRPDDPIPRVPPSIFALDLPRRKNAASASALKNASASTSTLNESNKRRLDSEEVEDGMGRESKKGRYVNVTLKSLMREVPPPVFKVPGAVLTVSGAKGKGKARAGDEGDEDDVFKVPSQKGNGNNVIGAGAGAAGEMEVGNKTRRKIKIVKLTPDEAERLVHAHVKMYFDGFGGPTS
ncbi:hypothetical protein M422DRAFT_244574 [Sphaerobolus stellatus SS14]|nr:hypothetical protein M422DRAFT_244574 [Sphaerobolus stellatus SS14]